MSKPQSIRARLYNIAKLHGIDFQIIATRYFHERLLFRLSLSSYNLSFLLKGGNWIYASQGLVSRPTTDIDFLGINISNDQDYLINVFRDIISSEVNDGVIFNKESLRAAPINENNQYQGLRLTVEASLDSIRQKIQIDIGFGDRVTPKPVQMNFPLLLQESSALTLWAYSVETVVAEKFHAMVSLGSINSRMKDVFDMYRIIQSNEISEKTLISAVNNTFDARRTVIDFSAVIFSEEYINDPQKEKQWRSFLKKINSDLEAPFSKVITKIYTHIKEIIEK